MSLMQKYHLTDLSPEEQLELAHELRDDVQRDARPLSEAQLLDLQHRLTEVEGKPDAVEHWSEVEARLNAGLS